MAEGMGETIDTAEGTAETIETAVVWHRHFESSIPAVIFRIPFFSEIIQNVALDARLQTQQRVLLMAEPLPLLKLGHHNAE